MNQDMEFLYMRDYGYYEECGIFKFQQKTHIHLDKLAFIVTCNKTKLGKYKIL